MIDLDALVQAAHDLEPLPASTTRLASLIARPESDLREISEVVSFDQGLTGRVLRVANSAASASRHPVKTVKEAVIRLGTGTVLSLAIGSNVQRRMRTAVPEYGLSEGELWQHSVASALAAEAAMPHCRVRVPPESFTAALLHDVGKLVLCRFIYPELRQTLEKLREESHLTRLQAEVEVLETHHGELGGLVAQHWKLPESIVKGISFHAHPEEGEETICYVVHLADVVAQSIPRHGVARGGNDTGDDSRLEQGLHPGIMERLGTTSDQVAAMRATVCRRVAEVLSRYD